MKICRRCQIRIADDTHICPLCSMVLTDDGTEGQSVYPEIRFRERLMKKIVSVSVYLLALAEIIFGLVNYYTLHQFSWSLITGICIAYAILTLLYSFNRRHGHIRKIFVQTLGLFFMLLLLDLTTGAKGWSVSYGIPCALLALDGILVCFMLVDFHNWQSYLLVQIFSVIISSILLILYLTGVTKNPVLPWVAFGVSTVIFSFCLLVGNRKAKDELKRRFYI